LIQKKTPLGCLCLALLLGGCAHKDDIAAMPAPKPEPTLEATVQPTPAPVPPAAAVPADSHYLVLPGDSLWKIASKDAVLGDSLRWPLLYKANRDQIADPDLIEPHQDLAYKAVWPAQEVADALKLAADTPPYVPHSAPRRPLPVKY
jgi:hypothetical protein